MVRGIRNNNPLNIRYNPANHWQGSVFNGVPDTTGCGGESGGTGRPLIKQSGINNCEPVAEREFEEFISMYYGFRAAIINIETYIIKYECNTIEKIITRWAPADDGNNTADYIANVCNATNIGGREPISNHDPRLKDIVAAMAVVECGDAIRDYFDALEHAWDNFTPREVYQRQRKRTCYALCT